MPHTDNNCTNIGAYWQQADEFVSAPKINNMPMSVLKKAFNVGLLSKELAKTCIVFCFLLIFCIFGIINTSYKQKKYSIPIQYIIIGWNRFKLTGKEFV